MSKKLLDVVVTVDNPTNSIEGRYKVTDTEGGEQHVVFTGADLSDATVELANDLQEAIDGLTPDLPDDVKNFQLYGLLPNGSNGGQVLSYETRTAGARQKGTLEEPWIEGSVVNAVRQAFKNAVLADLGVED